MPQGVSFNESNVKQLIFNNMKKIVTFIMGLVAFATLNAANTANVTLTLTANGGTEASQVKLRLDPSVTAPTYASWFQNLEAVGTVNIYAKIGAEKYSQYKYNTLTNVPLEVVANRRAASLQHYTITFSVAVNTETLYLTDLVLDPNNENPIAIVDGQSYEFDVNTTLHPSYVAGQNFTIADRFVINYVPAPVYSVTTNIDGWASYSSDVDLVAPTGLTVYAGTIVDEELILTSVDYIKANEGVIVKGAAGLTYTLTPGSGSSSYTNDLKPSSAWASHSGTIYCLHNEGVGTTAFYQYTGSDMPANKAYLQISATPSSAPKRISMRFNQPTAIENVELEAVKAEKFIENGQVLIKRGEIIYNVQGQIVK